MDILSSTPLASEFLLELLPFLNLRCKRCITKSDVAPTNIPQMHVIKNMYHFVCILPLSSFVEFSVKINVILTSWHNNVFTLKFYCTFCPSLKNNRCSSIFIRVNRIFNSAFQIWITLIYVIYVKLKFINNILLIIPLNWNSITSIKNK